MPVYLDCAATTRVDPLVREEMLRCLDGEYGNAGSRTHGYGQRARAAVEQARAHVAAAVGASRGDVVFTSGATESNNLAILGLARHGVSTGRRHIVSTAIEHHAVLEPFAALRARGFTVDLVLPGPSGFVDPDDVLHAVRPETLLVSVMHVNNETGVIQPVDEIASGLNDRDAFFHVDAAQGYGRDRTALRHPRIDLVSVSGHKIFGPQGVGALIMRRRAGARPPLEALMVGGGQERGLRPGTLPLPLIAGFGKAAELALAHCDARAQRCAEFRDRLLGALAPLEPVINGAPERSVPHIVNLSIPGVDAAAAIDAWQDLVAIAHGAACASQAYTCSHVLRAMGADEARADGALRFSWSHETPLPDVDRMVEAIREVRAGASRVAPPR